MATAKKKITIAMHMKNDTKGARRFTATEGSDETGVGDLYIRKEILPQIDNAEKVTLTLEVS